MKTPPLAPPVALAIALVLAAAIAADAAAQPRTAPAGTDALPSLGVANVRATQKPARPGSAATIPPSPTTWA